MTLPSAEIEDAGAGLGEARLAGGRHVAAARADHRDGRRHLLEHLADGLRAGRTRVPDEGGAGERDHEGYEATRPAANRHVRLRRVGASRRPTAATAIAITEAWSGRRRYTTAERPPSKLTAVPVM